MAKEWEAAFFETATPRTRKVALRTAITFSPAPGNAFQFSRTWCGWAWAARKATDGSIVSWIHETDFARASDFLIDREELDGPVNIAAPNPLPNREFMARAARGLGRAQRPACSVAPLIETRRNFSAHRIGTGAARAGASSPAVCSMPDSIRSFPTGPKPPKTSCGNGETGNRGQRQGTREQGQGLKSRQSRGAGFHASQLLLEMGGPKTPDLFLGPNPVPLSLFPFPVPSPYSLLPVFLTSE